MLARLGNYLLLERLNTGGMADVYLANAFGFGGITQTLALKCIRPEIAEDPAFVRMFVDEAKLAVLLDHDNIAQTFELGRIGSTYFMAMEYVLGRDLRALIDRVRQRGVELPTGLALQIIAQVCDALDYAHRKADPTGVPLHIVHRDVSPQNVLLGYGGEVKLIDFGIAKAATQASRSQAGVLKGKYGYMSPEQVRGLAIDSRSDVFAAGVLLFELLTGERLFPGASDFSVLEKVRYAEIYPPTLLVPQLEAEVEDVVLHALAADAKDRYASASEMHDALVDVMLRHYGQPSQRALASFILELFASEHGQDMQRLDKARRYDKMPADVPAMLAVASSPRDAPTRSETPGGGRTVVDPPPGDVQRYAAAPPPVDTEPGDKNRSVTIDTQPGAGSRAAPSGSQPGALKDDTSPGRVPAARTAVQVHPTEILRAPKRNKSRDLMIVLAAVVV
ncbi:MAG: protein kinase, partial [Deltaproteobacteria bacterium]|nr:protein kinase [Deltaproteobacteria bacterium]